MRVALNAARRGLGTVWPNPAVGCALVKDGRLIATGHTQPGGRPHAETDALKKAGDAAQGSTAYITLEPCAHTGKTPPCVDALIAAKVARVVTACEDPDLRTAGKGHLRLEQAGIDLTKEVCETEARSLNVGFLTRITKGRPHLTLKLATTIDGRIATQTGESRWITGPTARKTVHHLRSISDAILVGRGTAETDDPTLDVRGFGNVPQPLRLVVDRNGSLPNSLRLFADQTRQPTWRITGPDIPASDGSIPVALDAAGKVDLVAASATLADRGLTRVLCEGGGKLAASLIRAELVDRIVLFTAGKLIGSDGTACLASIGLTELSDAPSFTLAQTRRVGDDTMSVWTVC